MSGLTRPRLTWMLKRLIPHAALMPLAAIVLIAYVGSLVWTLRVSVSGSRSLPTDSFVGVAQYLKLFDNERWLLSLQNSGTYTILFIALAMLIGIVLAILIDQKIRGEALFRTVFLYPYAMSFVATGLVWQWMLTPGMGVEQLAHQWGYPEFEFDWLINQDKVIYTIVIAGVWQMAGLVMALVLAALRGIDEEIWKAARLDGIRAWRVYVSIILPMLTPTLATIFILLSTAALKLFDAVVAMTQGGPGTASEVPAKFIMDHLFGRANIALASAGAVVLLLAVIAIAAPYLYLQHQRKRALCHSH